MEVKSNFRENGVKHDSIITVRGPLLRIDNGLMRVTAVLTRSPDGLRNVSSTLDPGAPMIIQESSGSDLCAAELPSTSHSLQQTTKQNH